MSLSSLPHILAREVYFLVGSYAVWNAILMDGLL